MFKAYLSLAADLLTLVLFVCGFCGLVYLLSIAVD